MMITLQELHVRVPVREGTGSHCPHGETRFSSSPQPLSGGSGWSAGCLRRAAQYDGNPSRSAREGSRVGGHRTSLPALGDQSQLWSTAALRGFWMGHWWSQKGGRDPNRTGFGMPPQSLRRLCVRFLVLWGNIHSHLMTPPELYYL